MKNAGGLQYVKLIIPFIKPYWSALIISIICTILFAISNVYIMPLVNDISREVANKNFTHFTNHVINASILFFIRLSSKYLQTFVMEKNSLPNHDGYSIKPLSHHSLFTIRRI